MNAIEDDFRILAALRFDVGAGHYARQRDSLEEASWLVVDALRAAGFYGSVSTYPKWRSTAGMDDFGLVHSIFPVNGIDCLCVRIQPSPIMQSFSDSNTLAPTGHECRSILEEHREELWKTDGLSRVAVDSRWNKCLDDYRRASFTKSLRKIFDIKVFKEAFVFVSSGGVPTLLSEGEEGLLMFWLNLAGVQPMEVGFHYGGRKKV